MVKEDVEITDVDVIITTRNRVAELLTTIQRCIAIGFSPHQLFITDDASSDNTSEIIRHQYPEIKLQVNQAQSGLITNRNFMMTHSSRGYILSLDDDSNLLSSSDIQEALNLLNSKEEYGVFGFIPVEQLSPPHASDIKDNSVFISTWFIGCGHIIKRSTLQKVGLYREEFIFYGEEVDFAIRCFKLGLHVICKKNLVVHHRVDYSQRLEKFKAEAKNGENSNLWRKELEFANRVIRILLYYPASLIPYYATRTMLGYFYLLVVKNNWKSSYFNALKRVREKTGFIRQERNPLTIAEFYRYIKLRDLNS